MLTVVSMGEVWFDPRNGFDAGPIGSRVHIQCVLGEIVIVRHAVLNPRHGEVIFWRRLSPKDAEWVRSWKVRQQLFEALSLCDALEYDFVIDAVIEGFRR